MRRERKWKLNMAKKYVRAVARSNLDLESRKDVRQKEAELAVRRNAAFIGKEVGLLSHALPLSCMQACARLQMPSSQQSPKSSRCYWPSPEGRLASLRRLPNYVKEIQSGALQQPSGCRGASAGDAVLEES
jgi:hypothetical protein